MLNRLPGGFRWLQKNVRDHVVLYFETFADLLEEQLIQQIEIPKEMTSDHRPRTTAHLGTV